jgi:hypothetical protein
LLKTIRVGHKITFVLTGDFAPSARNPQVNFNNLVSAFVKGEAVELNGSPASEIYVAPSPGKPRGQSKLTKDCERCP